MRSSDRGAAIAARIVELRAASRSVAEEIGVLKSLWTKAGDPGRREELRQAAARLATSRPTLEKCVSRVEAELTNNARAGSEGSRGAYAGLDDAGQSRLEELLALERAYVALERARRLHSTSAERQSASTVGAELAEGRKMSPAEPAETIRFLQLLWGLDHALQRMSKHMRASLGVTGMQRLVIRELGEGEATAGHLAEALAVHPSTLTGVLQRLEQRDIVQRTRDPVDGRRSLLALTERGRALNCVREGTVESAVAKALGEVGENEVKAARSTLSAIEKALQEELAGHRPFLVLAKP